MELRTHFTECLKKPLIELQKWNRAITSIGGLKMRNHCAPAAPEWPSREGQPSTGVAKMFAAKQLAKCPYIIDLSIAISLLS
jgi:hypothetical protein